jgi:ABC-type sugar transport system ATPase subunit
LALSTPEPRQREERPRLHARGLSKRYGSQIAIQNVDLRIEAGEIVAVVGENGAGKSTLSKILSGAVRADRGTIEVDGQTIQLAAPRDALKVGISYIPQELAYFPNLTVADNLLVGQWPKRFGIVTTRPLVVAEAQRLADRFGIQMDVRRPLAELRLAERQLAEILKGLARDARVVVLDEPSASLTAEESRNLFRVLRGLAAVDVAILFISHRLDEVFEIADRIVVMRNARVVASVVPSQTSPTQLIEHMLGSEVVAAERALVEEHAVGAPALKVDFSRSGLPNIDRLAFELREGEVLGLFGPRGSGADIVADGLGGRIGDFKGRIEVEGRERSPFSTPRESRRAGIGYVPPERKRDGLVLGMSVEANLSMLVLRKISKAGLLRRLVERRQAQQWKEMLQIRCRSVVQRVDSLSGGNQQKVLLGSRLAAKPRILVLNEPTRGVDVGARAEIHRYLRDEARRGVAILWVTSDAEEAVFVSDRLLVMRDGVVVGELQGDAKRQSRALELATGEVHGEAA